MSFDLGGKKGVDFPGLFILFYLFPLMTLVIHHASFNILNLEGCH